MGPFEIVYLGRSRLHHNQDAAAMYFRVLRAGRYIGAYAGVVTGPDLAALGSPPDRRFWAALAHTTAGAIGVRLLGNIRTSADLHQAETILVKGADLRPHLGQDLPLPTGDAVFRRLELAEDPLAPQADGRTRILSAGSTSISLKAAALAAEDDA